MWGRSELLIIIKTFLLARKTLISLQWKLIEFRSVDSSESINKTKNFFQELLKLRTENKIIDQW